MTIETRQTNVPYSDALREHVARRLNHAMARFSERVGRARVWVEDLNGPRHGEFDKVCRIVAEVAPTGTVVAEARADDYYTAVTQACARLHAEVRRVMDRRHRTRALRSARLQALT
jgi:ribosomal subunit interface protein